MALLLVRAGVRTTLLCRTEEQARELGERRENERYLSGVELPQQLKVRALGTRDDQFQRSDLVFLAVPSKGIGEAIAQLKRARRVRARRDRLAGQGARAARRRAAEHRARALVRRRRGWRWSAAPRTRARWWRPAPGWCARRTPSRSPTAWPRRSRRAGVVCEVSDDPVGVELAGVAKNAAAVAVGATQAQGLNAAGMAAADIFLEVLCPGREERRHSRAPSSAAAAPATSWPRRSRRRSRNRSAGELLSEGVPAAEIPERLGQAVEALETVPLLAHAIERAGLEAPVTSALARLIEGTLPLDDWVELVRAMQPPAARFGRPSTWWARLRAWFRRRRAAGRR